MRRPIFTTLFVLSLVSVAVWGQNENGRPSAQPSPQAPQAVTGTDIVGMLNESGRYKVLLAALEATGLAETLKGATVYTLFAPNDTAFGRLPAGQLNRLMSDRQLLLQVLEYHLVPGGFLIADLRNISALSPLQGDLLTIRPAGGSVTIDDARVRQGDVLTTNGVIQAIDTVLIPRSLAPLLAPAPSASPTPSG